MKIILSSQMQIIEAPEPLLRKIRDTFTIENPGWIDNDRMARWNGGKDHWLTFYKNHTGGFTTTAMRMSGVLAASAKARRRVYRNIDGGK